MTTLSIRDTVGMAVRKVVGVVAGDAVGGELGLENGTSSEVRRTSGDVDGKVTGDAIGPFLDF